MTTLPKPCPKPECRAPIAHWHGGGGDIYACLAALNDKPCPDGEAAIPCRAPRETSPLHLPDVDAVAQAMYESYYGPQWDNQDGRFKDAYRRNARAALDLIAAHQPVWQRVEPGTVIKAGMRVREECPGGIAGEWEVLANWLQSACSEFHSLFFHI